MKWNILEWLNDNNGFIRLKNSELRFLTDDEMVYGIPTSEVRYDNLDVKYKLRTHKSPILGGEMQGLCVQGEGNAY